MVLKRQRWLEIAMGKGRISKEKTNFGACQMLIGRVLRAREERVAGWMIRQAEERCVGECRIEGISVWSLRFDLVAGFGIGEISVTSIERFMKPPGTHRRICGQHQRWTHLRVETANF